MKGHPRRATLTVLVSATVVLLLSGPAFGAAATGVYPSWTRGGGSGAWTVSGDFAAAGFPVAAATSDATTLSTPTGASAFLGADTPFGQAFGSSQGQPYVNVSTAAAFAASTTKLSFATPTPAAGWGFALGDVDADAVQINAVDANGNAVSATDLGFQATFNYCVNTPKPSTCTGPGPFTDVPTWNPGPRTLTGSGTDTLGASGWFRPAVALSSLTLTFTRQSGAPIFQLWLATLAVPLTGQVDGVTPADPPAAPGVIIDLQHADHTPVVDPAGDPITTKADDHGKFEFPAVVDGDYRVVIDPPAGTTNTGAHSAAVTVDVTNGPSAIPAGTFAVHVRPAATSAPTTSVSAAGLPATGAVAGPVLAAATLLLLGGVGLVLLGRSGRRAGQRAR